MFRPLPVIVASALVGIVLSACGSTSTSSQTHPTAAATMPAPIIRTWLGASSHVPGAHGRTLGLWRVVIPPHTKLALHRHPGTQVAFVSQGTLTYTVRRGHVKVMKGQPENGEKVVRTIGPGQTGTIAAGQWIVEQPTVIHFGANNTSRAVVIYLSTLFTTGSPPSIPVK